MPRFRCYSPMCPALAESPTRTPPDFEADRPKCPKCGAGDMAVATLIDVHYVVTGDGPIVGFRGQRQQVACQPDRPFLAGPGENFSATGDPQAVTCPACKRHEHWQAAAKALAAVRPGFTIADGGCC